MGSRVIRAGACAPPIPKDGFYDRHDDEELAKKMSDYERKKKQYANLYCRRQRMEDRTCQNMGTNVLLKRADR